jgi:hypothetical protein
MAEPEKARDSSSRVQIMVALIGLAGVIATALIANWNNISPRKAASPPPAAATSSAPGSGTGKKSERPVHSSGRLLVRGTYTYDLDNGTETPAGADFQWEQQTPVIRFLAPMNRAAFYVVGPAEFESVRWSDMERFPYSTAKVPANADSSNRIPAGTVVAFKTNEGRLGKFIVDEYGYNLTIRWRTYD